MKNYWKVEEFIKKECVLQGHKMTRSYETLSKAGSPFAVLENILFIKHIAQFEAF